MSQSIQLAASIRISALKMVFRAKASHIGGALSMADILGVLYSDILQIRPSQPDWELRDRLILSKGHSCTALYAALAHKGFFPLAMLDTYAQDGSAFMSHISHKVPGVEFSTGSLGHGLSFGVGKALAAARKQATWRTFVILSDGELDEGSNWEALLFAPHHRLNNLIIIIDYNKIQSYGTVEQVLSLGDLGQKLCAFGWEVRRCDGHAHDKLKDTLSQPPASSRPIAVIADTIKGKGVSYMEGSLLWHYKNPDENQLEMAELEILSSLRQALQ